MNRATFSIALAFTLKWEGGYSDHPLDPGGATNFGITQRTYDEWRKAHGFPARSVKEIDESEVESIYFDEYWLKVGCDHLNDEALAIVAFDTAVHSGVKRTANWLQKATDWPSLISVRLDFMTRLQTWGTFGTGWGRRIADLINVAGRVVEPSERLIVALDSDGKQIAVIPVGSADVLLRVRGQRVYIRPDAT